ncbi:hypothetical protein IV36_GL002131 [Liquorilactobacillus mali]|uniref:Integral membrane protein n=2 Tax=Liquorilactobacillus mali TaxID=1618 RepID=A0A0R2FQH3_9LACO|nr:hypothetical protein IV36_GL002131 [Liquorilactobacillus mali]
MGVLIRMKTRRELKSEVKETFKGHWNQAIKLAIIPVIFQIITTIFAFTVVIVLSILIAKYSDSIAKGLSTTGTTGNFDHNNLLGNSVGGIISSMLLTGIGFTFLDWLRTKNADFSALKGAFSVFTKRNFLGVLVLYILINIFIFFWSLLFIIPGIVKSFAYSQTYFVYKDMSQAENADDFNFLDYITKSRELMNGHKFEFFVLKLSFIGWDILAILTLGIGYIWLTPYKLATYAAYYNSLAEGSDIPNNQQDKNTDDKRSVIVEY